MPGSEVDRATVSFRVIAPLLPSLARCAVFARSSGSAARNYDNDQVAGRIGIPINGSFRTGSASAALARLSTRQSLSVMI
jgi:hypothetical protein